MCSQLKQMVTQKLLNMFYKNCNSLFPYSVLRVSQPYFGGGTPEIIISYPEEIPHIKMFTSQKKFDNMQAEGGAVCLLL